MSSQEDEEIVSNSLISESTKASHHCSHEKKSFKKVEVLISSSSLNDSERNLKNDSQDDFMMKRLNSEIEKDIYLNRDNFTSTYSMKNPRRLGNTFAFWYKNSEPRIIIGPHCKYFSLIILIILRAFLCLSQFIY